MPLSHPGVFTGYPSSPHQTHTHPQGHTETFRQRDKHSEQKHTHKAQAYFYNSKGTSSKKYEFRWEIPGELKDTVMCF